ncbi:hypothetical membrane protein [Amycolatopsis marina]|uniref:Hypothetical membrane protein n=1 Tax=Amycolatopsis marina TaxID=490629 RepID=A0A1I0Y6J4_9PSEU|nr:DUF998 domain-containing protein [Amycolatopsis marina]SFB08891.1 hypothetical membrane protein [Amycolatopsis marina]
MDQRTRGRRGTTAIQVAGALCFLLLIQFFVLHVVVESAWTTPYSWATNAISDLGTARSPWHTAMNVSFVVNGLCMAAGGLLLGRAVSEQLAPGSRHLPLTAAALLAIAGAGTVLVGLNPGDQRVVLHLVGAFAATILGNAGVLLLGLSMRRAGRPGWAAGIAGGVLGFAGAAVTGLHLLGALPGQHEWGGAAERVAIFPMLIAMILIGGAQLLPSGVGVEAD